MVNGYRNSIISLQFTAYDPGVHLRPSAFIGGCIPRYRMLLQYYYTVVAADGTVVRASVAASLILSNDQINSITS
jgi:hypothetical protein